MATNPSLASHPGVDDWLSFNSDGSVVVRSGKVDIGQRISAAVSLVAAEELDLDPRRIVVAPRETGKAPDEGYTSGSRSMVESAQAVRLAAATARRHLLRLAANRLEAEADDLEIEDGTIRVPGTNRSTTYTKLAGDAPLSIPVDPDAAVKAPDDHRILGRPRAAPSLYGLTTGATKFVHDMALPGMLHARVVRPPHYNAKLEALEPEVENRLDGGKMVRDGSFLAVAHTDEWMAIRLVGRVAAAATWAPERGLSDGNIFEMLLNNPRTSFPVVDGTPVEKTVPPLGDPPPRL